MTSPPPADRRITVDVAAYCLAQMADTNRILVVGGNNFTETLHAVAEHARELTGADYAAISTFDEQDRLDRFVYAGIDEDIAHDIGDPPRGRGLLGALVGQEQPIRIATMEEHPASCGFPPGHPPMGPFLGVPIRANNRTIGSLYMTRVPGAPPFDEAADLTARLLALQVAVRLSHALATEQNARLSLLEERTRIAHDLHDGTIQVLYAMGLEAEAATHIRDIDPAARDLFASHIDRINALIADIRGYISVLEADAPPAAPELARDLAYIARTLVPQGIETVLNVKAAALQELGAREAEDLLFIAREAVSNAVRHGDPTRVGIDLRQSQHETALAIQDNGKGYETGKARTGLGTISMRTRAERLGAQLTVLSIPGMGTTVRVVLPRKGTPS